MSDPQSTVGPPTERTLANIRRARAHSFCFGPYHVEWKGWTGGFRFVPFWSRIDTEFWNQGPVRWRRGYWLTGGVSITQSLPERRAYPHIDTRASSGRLLSWMIERRVYPYGVSEVYTRRTGGD